MAKKKRTRPAAVESCNNCEDHGKHPWRPEGVRWAEGVFLHCPGYNRAEAAENARLTEASIRKARKLQRKGR